MKCSKVTYESKQEAKQDANHVHVSRRRFSSSKKTNNKLTPYECDICGKWHLTSMTRNEQRIKGYKREKKMEIKSIERNGKAYFLAEDVFKSAGYKSSIGVILHNDSGVALTKPVFEFDGLIYFNIDSIKDLYRRCSEVHAVRVHRVLRHCQSIEVVSNLPVQEEKEPEINQDVIEYLLKQNSPLYYCHVKKSYVCPITGKNIDPKDKAICQASEKLKHKRLHVSVVDYLPANFNVLESNPYNKPKTEAPKKQIEAKSDAWLAHCEEVTKQAATISDELLAASLIAVSNRPRKLFGKKPSLDQLAAEAVELATLALEMLDMSERNQ